MKNNFTSSWRQMIWSHPNIRIGWSLWTIHCAFWLININVSIVVRLILDDGLIGMSLEGFGFWLHALDVVDIAHPPRHCVICCVVTNLYIYPTLGFNQYNLLFKAFDVCVCLSNFRYLVLLLIDLFTRLVSKRNLNRVLSL